MADRKRQRDTETLRQQLEINEGRTNRDRGPNADTEQTGGRSAVTGGAAGGQRRDTVEEDSDSEEEDSDSTYRMIFSEDVDSFSDNISDSTSQSSISEHVVSFSDDISDSTSQLSISEHGESASDFSSVSSSQLRISEDKILIGLFNSNSINMKQSRISKLKNKFKLEALMLTETRVTEENGDQRLGEIAAGEFQVFHQPRVNQEGKSKKHTGGGVAILSSNDLRGTRVRFEDTSFKSFEYVAVDLKHKKWDQPLRTVTVYRPPGGNDEDMRKFREEFQKLLDKFSKDDRILITGDFNIWVNDKKNKHTELFKKLLRDNGLHQQVEEPTHNKGNTLDLVITRNVDISITCVKKAKKKTKTVIDKKTKKEKKKNITISDHYAVIFIVRQKNPTDPSRKRPRP